MKTLTKTSSFRLNDSLFEEDDVKRLSTVSFSSVFSKPSSKFTVRPVDSSKDKLTLHFHSPFLFPSKPTFKDYYHYFLRRDSNFIKTTKYTLLTFIPLNILSQFRRLSNIYYIVIMLINMIPEVSPIPPVTSVLPVLFIFCITLIREGIEEISKYYADIKANNYKVRKYTKLGWGFVKTRNVCVGDVIEVREGQNVPCDMIVLGSTKVDNSCFIQTSNLDGETNLKRKQGVCGNVEYDFEVDVEEPNEKFEQFNGKILVKDKTYSLGEENLLLRGCQLKRTKSVVGIAAYVGKKTKMFMNLKKNKSKWGKLDRSLNNVVFSLFIVQQLAVLCLVAASFISSLVLADDMFYIENITLFGTEKGTLLYYVVFFVSHYLTFFVLTENIIPMSVCVTMEVVKVFQGKYMEFKIKEDGIPMVAKTSNLNWDLANIDIVFTDKTGTLTENVMEYRNTYTDGCYFTHKMLVYKEKENNKTKQLFLLNVLLNNTVIPNIENARITYDAESTDEIALVNELALKNKFILKKRTKIEIDVEIYGKEIKYVVLNVLPFNSDRKRMSIIVKDEHDRIIMFSKGADSEMFKRRTKINDNVKEFDEAVLQFSEQGYRILVFGYRYIDNNEYNRFKDQLVHAESSLENRNLLIETVYDKIERGFILNGVTGIEDKLQDDVPETLDLLLKAGINVWVLTGDKTETAINICRSSNIIKRNKTFEVLLTGSSYYYDDDELKKRIGILMKFFEEKDEKDNREFCLIIDNYALSTLFEKYQYEFIIIIKNCKSVVCCRVTPYQKARITELVQDELQLRGLSIGDGANDVCMIQKAYVGVGIMGKEGSQAARASDYAIPKFRNLSKLLLVEGRYSYVRSTDCVLLSFYKNIISIIFKVFYSFFNLFTGQILLDPWIYQLYNTLFHMLIPLYFGFFEEDLPENMLLENPSLYKELQENPFFNFKRVALWIFYAIFQGSITFISSYYIVGDNDDLLGHEINSNDIFLFGHIMTQVVMISIYITHSLEEMVSIIFLICFGEFYCV